MDMDKATFFRKFILNMCSSLNIQKALEKCQSYFEELFPCSQMSIHLPVPEENFVHIIASAGELTKSMAEVPQCIPLPEELQIEAIQSWVKMKSVTVINDIGSHPLFGLIYKSLGLRTDLSALILKIEMEKNRIGSLWVLGKKAGKYDKKHIDFIESIHDPLALIVSNALQYQQLLSANKGLTCDNAYYRGQLLKMCVGNIVGEESGLKMVMKLVRQVASYNSPVLITGETGVGKEIIANAIHHLSSRGEKPLIKVNCGAIPETLIDSELFGFEKGAFTGAHKQQKGKFERANGGTIFLDEISEMTPLAQLRLLRVLQNRELERIGGSKTIHTDVRVIAATNKDLEEMVRLKKFREDLWFRLNVFPIRVPPLRERKGDIPLFIDHFIKLKSEVLQIRDRLYYDNDDIVFLKTLDWPGNVRELENFVERALIRNEGGGGILSDFTEPACYKKNVEKDSHFQKRVPSLDEAITQCIEAALRHSGGKISGLEGAAEILQIHPNTLRNKMIKLGILKT